jgi:hypothetical protein
LWKTEVFRLSSSACCFASFVLILRIYNTKPTVLPNTNKKVTKKPSQVSEKVSAWVSPVEDDEDDEDDDNDEEEE